jgi:hypothetical protein
LRNSHKAFSFAVGGDGYAPAMRTGTLLSWLANLPASATQHVLQQFPCILPFGGGHRFERETVIGLRYPFDVLDEIVVGIPQLVVALVDHVRLVGCVVHGILL